jgi:molybdopterin-containing oxidoreductase family iron-sulfur binding subunit
MRYGLVIDLERCIGCQACVVACKMENGIDRGSWMRVEMPGGQPLDTASGIFPEVELQYLPVTCMHCQQPPCGDACPTGAIYKRIDGIVVLVPSLCNGCEVCLSACPYGVIQWDDITGVARKCHLCSHRVDQGLEPYCVICCEGQALRFGDFDDPDSEVSFLAEKRSGYVLKREEETCPTACYLPPLSKRPV